MNLLEQLLREMDSPAELQARLITLLEGNREAVDFANGQTVSRAEAQELLRELIPTEIVVRRVCRRSLPVVIAAPHVSFDHWAEYFVNRLARALGTGWVVARNFRDQDHRQIPVAIGRHVHVNRPTESTRPGGRETETVRSRAIHEAYLQALARAGGQHGLPLALLIEIHSHHRSPDIECATAGVDAALADVILRSYEAAARELRSEPELRIEPLHPVRLTAERTKESGSLRPAVARRALHVELPREARRLAENRHRMCRTLLRVLSELLQNLEGGSAVRPDAFH